MEQKEILEIITAKAVNEKADALKNILLRKGLLSSLTFSKENLKKDFENLFYSNPTIFYEVANEISNTERGDFWEGFLKVLAGSSENKTPTVTETGSNTAILIVAGVLITGILITGIYFLTKTK